MATEAAISRLTGHLAGRHTAVTSAAAVGVAQRPGAAGWGGAVRPGTHGNMARLNVLLAQARRVRGILCVVLVLVRRGFEKINIHSVGSQLRPGCAGRVGLAGEVCPLRVDGLDHFQRFLRRQRLELMSPSHRPPVARPRLRETPSSPCPSTPSLPRQLSRGRWHTLASSRVERQSIMVQLVRTCCSTEPPAVTTRYGTTREKLYGILKPS